MTRKLHRAFIECQILHRFLRDSIGYKSQRISFNVKFAPIFELSSKSDVSTTKKIPSFFIAQGRTLDIKIRAFGNPPIKSFRLYANGNDERNAFLKFRSHI